MDYDQFKTFYNLTHTKNFTKTAEMLHVTQSTVTSRIKNLEKELGKPLFKRNNRRVELTLYGKKALPYTKRIIDLFDEFKITMQLEDKYQNRIVIGSVHSLWDYTLVPLVEKYREDHAKTTIRLITGHSIEVVQKLIDGSIDFGVVYIPPTNPDIVSIPVFSDSIHMVAHKDFSLNKDPALSEDLSNYPLIYLNWGQPFSEWYQNELGSQYTPDIEVDHATTLMQLILNKKGVGFVTRSVLKNSKDGEQLKIINYKPEIPIPQRLVYMIYLNKHEKNEEIMHWLELLQSTFNDAE